MAIFMRPLVSTVSSPNQKAIAPASNLSIDEPAMVWRSDNLSSVYITIDLGSDKTFDTIALVGSNIRGSDTITIETGTTASGTGQLYIAPQAAFTGTLPEGTTSKCIKTFSAQTARYIRLSFDVSGHPDGYLEAARVVVGTALEFGEQGGIELAAEQSFFDRSVEYSGDGWNSFDQFAVLPQWKVAATFIDEDIFANQWFGFLSQIGKHQPILFVPQTFDESRWQSEAIYGRVINQANATVQGHDIRRCELTMRALAQ